MRHEPDAPAARRLLSRPQAAGLVLVLGGVAYLFASAPSRTGLVAFVCALGACGVIWLHQLIVFVIGLRATAAPILKPDLADPDLPRYTVLVPLRQETAVLPGLVSALERLDYPKRLLDLKLLVESDDLDMLAVLRTMCLGPQFELVEIPADEPRTKPRACNFGLCRARGEFVVIYDAEDVPEPDQLRRAVAAFKSAPPHVACFQARLGIWNPCSNLLTRYVTARLCANFNVGRAGLEQIGAPIPLGGTSNHFPIEILVQLGGWDPCNVTEDADLGVRLARAGYSARLLDSWTYEEATLHLGNWLRQQSRWIKGFAQTWLVHTRSPVALVRDLGIRRAAHIQLTLLRGIVPVLLAPLWWISTLLWILAAAGWLDPPVPMWTLAAGAAAFTFGTATSTWAYATALRRFGHHDLLRSCILFPACELVRSVAAFRAAAQLITRPSYWEKTVHGFEAPLTAAESDQSASAQ